MFNKFNNYNSQTLSQDISTKTTLIYMQIKVCSIYQLTEAQLQKTIRI